MIDEYAHLSDETIRLIHILDEASDVIYHSTPSPEASISILKDAGIFVMEHWIFMWDDCPWIPRVPNELWGNDE
jgi:hypothetical protein